MKYFHEQIEAKWQEYWAKNQTFAASNNSEKPKYYVLDMFPYPSGAGLHVGHPLGYIASDIVARYKRHKGFNVLHPQGYDSFGLPAEQYAIQTGQHPEKTTRENIARYREQLDKIGFSFDWSREVRTSNPDYYKWTQWIFIQLFNSWYNNDTNQAEDIATLVEKFQTEGNANVNAVCDDNITPFTAAEWIASAAESSPETGFVAGIGWRIRPWRTFDSPTFPRSPAADGGINPLGPKIAFYFTLVKPQEGLGWRFLRPALRG